MYEGKNFFLDLSNQFFRLEVVSFSVVRKDETIPENMKFYFPFGIRCACRHNDGGKERNNKFFFSFLFWIKCFLYVHFNVCYTLHCQTVLKLLKNTVEGHLCDDILYT